MARLPAKLDNEITPEADRLGDYPHPRHTHRLHGHGGAEAVFAAAFATNHVHHAWLIRGPEGIGKATLAYRVAKHALAHPLERDRLGGSLEITGDTSAARQVDALSHPNLLVIRRPWLHKEKRFAASIPVDEVRRLRNFLALSAEAAAWRIVIVDSADELLGPAANALLKSLEEPPPRLVFLLISSEPGRLLPTIRSRCRTITLAKLTDADLRRATADAVAATDGEPPDDTEWPKLAGLADGRVRRALTLAATGGLKTYDRLEALLGALPKVDWPAVHALTDDLSPAAAQPKYDAFMDLLLDILARVISSSASGTADPRLKFAHRLIPAGRLATFADVWETTVRERAEVEAYNLDRKSLVLETISRLAAAART